MSLTALEPNMTLRHRGESQGRVLPPGDKLFLEGSVGDLPGDRR